MGLLDKHRDAEATTAARAARDEDPPRQFEYLARNLKKVVGPALEADLNEHGLRGWEAVCATDGYLVFKRELPSD